MRYLFSALSSYGFLFPSVAIAQELARRGHSVAFATDPSMGPALAGAGMERIPRGAVDGPSFQIQYAGHPVESMRQVRHLTHAIGVYGPDVLVGTELAHGTVVAGEYHHVPTAMIGLGAYLWATDATSRLDDAQRREWIERRHTGWVRSMNLTRAGLGMRERQDLPEGANPLLGDLHLLRSVPELEGPDETECLPPQVHMVGGCLWSNARPDPELDGWMADAAAAGEPIVYAQMGRFFEKPGFWGELAEAFGGQRIRLAVSVGRMDRPVTSIPDNFFVRPHVPQEQVLPHARAVICTSTTTPVIGALREGLPLLLIPGGGGGEQGDLIHRCRRAGVARFIRTRDATGAHILEAMREMLDDGSPLQRSARALRPAFGRVDGIRTAADHLEHLGAGREPVLRDRWRAQAAHAN